MALRRLTRDIDTVVHAAGPASVSASFRAARRYVRTHVLGTATVLNACRTRVAEVARLIVRRRRIAVESATVSPARRPPDRLVADPRRAARLLGWRPRVGLRAGLARTIRWMDAR